MIYDTVLISSYQEDDFEAKFSSAISAYTRQELRVEVQFCPTATSASTRFSALVIAYRHGT